MEYAAELPAEVSETTSGEFRECRTRFAIKIEGGNRGGEGKNPVTTDRPESRTEVCILCRESSGEPTNIGLYQRQCSE